MAKRLPLYVTASRGTEDLLAAELTELGAAKVRQDRGGVRIHANLHEALRICLWSRIGMRVLYPLVEGDVEGQEGLYQLASTVPWEEHLSKDTTFAVEATLKETEHDHSGFVALKIKDALVDRLRTKLGERPNVDTRSPDVRVVAHLHRKKLSLSLDLCGDPLYQRAYRVKTTVAPLKETLAAAVLRAARYTGEEPLVDPMCGSGTFLCEAGLIAARKAPGLSRQFAVERWPSLGAEARTILTGLRDEARGQERKPPAPIFGFDRDEEAVAAAQTNVRAAGFGGSIRVSVHDVLTTPPVGELTGGLLVTNPPYGDRLQAGGQKGMKTFYFKLGDSLGKLKGFRKAIIVGNEAFESAFHHRPTARRELYNGPIACELFEYPAAFVPPARPAPPAAPSEEPA